MSSLQFINVSLDNEGQFTSGKNIYFVNPSNSNSVAGESSLDRLACGLGGKTVLPHIIVTVPQMLQNGEFIGRYVLQVSNYIIS